jgi:nitroimidazol reductase NimA-like FMN-containing flavoprotein (pyridoxamine 5'-phosphate oxidase superfamily)
MTNRAGERAQRLIEETKHMTLATADRSGNPWVSPVFFVPDDAYDLYWVSAKSARHSQNVRDNPSVAIVVYETEPQVDAVYIAARAEELNDSEEVRRGMEVVARRKQPPQWEIDGVGDVTGAGPWRIYCAVVDSIEVRRPGEEGGKAVVVREPADFRDC